ncbi:MAG: c-type cytochrome [Parvularculaceae bacterium]
MEKPELECSMKRTKFFSLARGLIGAGVLVAAGGALAPAAFAGATEGKQIFDAKGCANCHQMTGPSDPLPVSQRASIKGPPLWFAGSKFKEEWLTSWLENPTPIRRVKYGALEKGANDHAALSAAEAADVGAYLMSLVDSEMSTGEIEEGALSRRVAFKAEKLFTKKQVCFGCHEYPSRRGDIGGFSGPSLVKAGERLNGDWVYFLLQDNVRFYPNGRMPTYGDEAFDAYTDDELRLLAQYIAGLGAEGE